MDTVATPSPESPTALSDLLVRPCNEWQPARWQTEFFSEVSQWLDPQTPDTCDDQVLYAAANTGDGMTEALQAVVAAYALSGHPGPVAVFCSSQYLAC